MGDPERGGGRDCMGVCACFCVSVCVCVCFCVCVCERERERGWERNALGWNALGTIFPTTLYRLYIPYRH
jgi:hypothetical protein